MNNKVQDPCQIQEALRLKSALVRYINDFSCICDEYRNELQWVIHKSSEIEKLFRSESANNIPCHNKKISTRLTTCISKWHGSTNKSGFTIWTSINYWSFLSGLYYRNLGIYFVQKIINCSFFLGLCYKRNGIHVVSENHPSWLTRSRNPGIPVVLENHLSWLTWSRNPGIHVVLENSIWVVCFRDPPSCHPGLIYYWSPPFAQN